MKNIDVIKAFLEKRAAKGSNLYSDRNKLINYKTTLAQWHDNYHLIINKTKYSVSTSKNQNYLEIATAIKDGIVVKEVYNIPINTEDLEQYTNMNKYTVIINEILSKPFEVEAESYGDAIQKVKDKYYNSDPDYILSADDYYYTDFDCIKV